jgi:probable rRNA maturation factor
LFNNFEIGNTMKIQFFFLQQSVTLTQRKRLKSYIETIFKVKKKPLTSLKYIFCSDKYLLEINRRHLQHNFYTDVITFNLSSTKLIEGEIYISIERVKENASNLGVSNKEELHRVIFHGALHLCGYKDKTSIEQSKMRKAEDICLNEYFK